MSRISDGTFVLRENRRVSSSGGLLVESNSRLFKPSNVCTRSTPSAADAESLPPLPDPELGLDAVTVSNVLCDLAIGVLFVQIDENAAVYANIQGLARSPEIRQNSRGKSQMATAANSASDRCNTSLTARFKMIVMPKH